MPDREAALWVMLAFSMATNALSVMLAIAALRRNAEPEKLTWLERKAMALFP